MKPTGLLLVLFLLFSDFLFAQTIFLRAGAVRPKANINTFSFDSLPKLGARFANKMLGVIQFERIPGSEEKNKLAASGIELLDYLPDNAYTVAFRGVPAGNVLQQAGARAVFQLTPKQKMQAYFANGIIPSWAVKVAGTVDVWISFYKTLDPALVLESLKEQNIDILLTDRLQYRVIALRIAANRIDEIAALPFIEFIQPAPPKDQPLNYNSRIGSKANILQATVADGGRGLTGEGVVVGHGDNADLQAHADFSGRLINRNASPFNVHGSHTAGTIAGAGIINELYKGYAPKATLLSQSFSSIIDHAAVYVQENRMVITNNSYGNIVECDYHGTYDLTSRILDEQALDHPNLLHVFAAGNSGNSTCKPYPAGYRTVLGGYQAAKNSITVGATNDTGALAGLSSRGPVKDGRVKPELTAMGQGVVSSWPVNTYAPSSGTSMSAPAVSGGLALLYQRYRQLHGGADPKNGLLKAVLCNGALDLGNVGPDFQYGFGWMNLLRSVEMLEATRYFSGNSLPGGNTTHSITVPANTSRLNVLLYWNDLPASVVSTKTLVNDLDLEVVDPSGAVILPKILDTAMTAVANVAVNSVDRVNNMEQVIINNPIAGNYTIRVKGTTVTTARQEYFVAFDPVPLGIKLTAPAGGEALLPGESIKIAWESNGLTGPAILEFSSDGGNTWSPIASGLDVTRRFYTWTVPATATGNAVVRITGSSQTSSSAGFTILGQPVITLSPVQCEDYIAINWTSIEGATGYEVMLLHGDEMKPVATTTATSFLFSGLSKDSTYFVTVRAMLAAKAGRRGIAVSRQPNNGTCAGSISDSDVKLDALLSPASGRHATSTALGSAQRITIRVKNLDDTPVSSFTVSYALDNSSPVTETITIPLPAGAAYEHTFSAPLNLSQSGLYTLKSVVKNSGDQNTRNDTLITIIRHLANEPLLLNPLFADNLEGAEPATYEKDTVGLVGLERYDFVRTTPWGRLRTYFQKDIAASGSKAITLDASRYHPAGNVNYLLGTFNLINYAAATSDIRLDFLYRHHRQMLNEANKVWIRGSDTEPWIVAYNLDSVSTEERTYHRVKSIPVSALLRTNGQAAGSSFQVRWGQWGQWPATDAENGAGYTIDGIRLYQVFNDVQLVKIDSPVGNNCDLGAASRITVTVRNNSHSAIANVPIKYRVNNGAYVTETITAVPAGTDLLYTFTTPVNMEAAGAYTIQALIDLPSDTFRENDTATAISYNQSLITSFPYLQNFEMNNGGFYTAGHRSSWEYGTPESLRIKGAASGARAWKTRLQGSHNDWELSYLYSPCFDLTGMSAPTISFSVALDIEDCGTALCDAAWVEYSADGATWQKLGTAGAGTNWYNKPLPRNNWSIQNYTSWHVATQALPTGISRLRLRFVLAADGGVAREGMAIDDIHVYDNIQGIYDGPTLPSPLMQTVSGNGWTHFTEGGKLVASVRTQGQSLGNTAVQAFINNGAARFSQNQYYHNRNLTIKPAAIPADSVLVRFYFTDRETDSLVKAAGCATCKKPGSAYDLGISQYTAADKALENGSLTDNLGGLWHFIPSASVTKVPFDIGYYAEFKASHFSEFWLNSGGADLSTPLPVKLMTIIVTRQGNNVVISWKVGSETDVLQYEVEVARGEEALQAGRFEKVGEVQSGGTSFTVGSYTFTDTEADKFGTRYYRVKIVNQNGSFQYSPVRVVTFNNPVTWQVYPNPGDGRFYLTYQAAVNDIVVARLYDAKGSLVKEISNAASGFLQKLNFDISANNYASGVYLLRVSAGAKERAFKLYKQ